MLLTKKVVFTDISFSQAEEKLLMSWHLWERKNGWISSCYSDTRAQSVSCWHKLLTTCKTCKTNECLWFFISRFSFCYYICLGWFEIRMTLLLITEEGLARKNNVSMVCLYVDKMPYAFNFQAQVLKCNCLSACRQRVNLTLCFVRFVTILGGEVTT